MCADVLTTRENNLNAFAVCTIAWRIYACKIYTWDITLHKINWNTRKKFPAYHIKSR